MATLFAFALVAYLVAVVVVAVVAPVLLAAVGRGRGCAGAVRMVAVAAVVRRSSRVAARLAARGADWDLDGP